MADNQGVAYMGTGGSVNPARTLGPDVATSIFGGSVPWGELWVYWAGPLVGGAIAAVAYDVIATPERAAAAAAKDRVEGTEGAVEGRRVLPEQ